MVKDLNKCLIFPYSLPLTRFQDLSSLITFYWIGFNNHQFFSSFPCFIFLTLFRMGVFGAAHGWGWGGGPKGSLPKICHTYPTMMELGTAKPYLRKIQKIHKSHDAPLGFC